MTEFTDISIRITNQLDKHVKKEGGIYFTPNSIVNHMFDTVMGILTKHPTKIQRVLEPSCGSGQIVQGVLDRIPGEQNVQIDAFETNELIVHHVREHYKNNGNVNVILGDFLLNNRTTAEQYYDLIVGNPPYFVMKRADMDPAYKEWVDGRPNIYILFVLKALDLLTPETGILSLVLPTNFLNCMYYKKVRQRIIETCTICEIKVYEDSNFIDTKQGVVLLTVQKRKPCENANEPYVIHGHVLNTIGNVEKLRYLYKGATSLSKLGCTINVGSVVWNQHKRHLHEHNNGKQQLVPILYANDIKSTSSKVSALTSGFKNPDKKRYIDYAAASIPTDKLITTPLLVMNRGYGSGKYTLCAAVYDACSEKEPFVAENHVLCIRTPPPRKTNDTNFPDGVVLHEAIQRSFDDPRTAAFVSIYCTNNALNVYEILELVPIYI